MWRLLLNKVVVSVNSWLDIYRKPDELLLSVWFDKLYGFFRSEEKKGSLVQKIWYQKPGENEITDTPNESPLYKVKTLVLPETVKDKKKYFPQISEVTLVSEFPSEGQPEIQTWRLNLSLFDEKGKYVWPEIVFSCFQSREDLSRKHEIRYSQSRDLTMYEVKLIKSVFDKAIS